MEPQTVQGRIYFGTKKSNYCFNKQNSKDKVNQVSEFFNTLPFETKKHYEYHKNDFVYTNEIGYLKIIKKYELTDTDFHTEYTLNTVNMFPQGIDYSYKNIEDQAIFKINEKICLIITNLNYIYIEYTKDHDWDNTSQILAETISTIRKVYN
jgi:hypothetical protein